MQQRSLSCWQCGTVLSAPGGRCPACGAEQRPEPSIPRSARARASSDPDGESRPTRTALVWVALAVGLTVIGAAAVLLGPRGASEFSARAPVASSTDTESGKTGPTNVGALDLRAVDPTE